MIIHCLSCGKCVSSNMHNCPYCISEINDQTLAMNGIAVQERPRIREKFAMMVGLASK